MFGVSLQYPQLLVLLLLLPWLGPWLAGSVWRASGRRRTAILILAIFALARPRVGLTDPGSDLILLLDRSASCGREAERMLAELLPLIRREERAGDRTAVIAFGDGAFIERGFADGAPVGAPPVGFEFASDLASALETAAALRSPDRRTALLCLSDGLYTGEKPQPPGIPFWYRRLGEKAVRDAAAGAIVAPEEVELRSAWLVRYSIQAAALGDASYALFRNGRLIARENVALRRGENRFLIRDAADGEALIEYRLEISAESDAVPENNVSRAVLPVRSAPRVLLATRAEEPVFLAECLRAAAIPVDVVRPEHFPEDASRLAPYRLIILENCRLADFPFRAPGALASAVRAGLASLLVTGGPNSFGQGGYHRSAIDPLLPVGMELRDDVRRGGLAVAIALDRSGSMAAGAGTGGPSKMDLANRGAAESLRLLNRRDEAAVVAVDSAAHVVAPLGRADEPERLAELVLDVKSMGGGIYCLTALRAAAAEIRKSGLANRHIILFADAADVEERDGCLELARELLDEGIRLSVVAIGTTSDPDADFLGDLAREGGGEALFSRQADGLPALFSQEMIRISRRGFLEEPIVPRFLAPMRLLGLGDLPPPGLDGHNVSFLRQGAIAFMDIDDEFNTPLLALRPAGRAAVGAALFEIDGEFSGGFTRWPAAPALLAALARRLASGVQAVGVKAYTSLDRGMAEAWFEFSPEMALKARSGGAKVNWLGAGGIALPADLEWIEPQKARSRVKLSVPGHYLPLADLGEIGTAAAPPASLSYSSEFALRPGGRGRAALEELAAAGGGDGLDISRIRESAAARRTGGRELRPWLLLALLALFLAELAGSRRLH
ncbi:MAG: VWA domain-containing protein [Planctomycetota bacterium]|jgi:hypothetical protein|nr:VWA domain-containing protein [Planctomycetota bacterium]